MANILGNYDEIAFGQEALICLYNQLGMASRVYRDYDPSPKAKGQNINLRRPSQFTAVDQPGTAQDMSTESVQINLGFHKGVSLKITDKELSLTNDKLVEDHINPMAYAIAKDIDTRLCGLFARVPNVYQQANSTFSLSDIASVRQTLFDKSVPMDGKVSLMVNGAMENNILSALGGSSMFGAKVDEARVNATIGRLYGMDIFANQNTPTFATSQAADVIGAAPAAAVGVSSFTATAFGTSIANTVVAGDTFAIAGQSQRYSVTAAANSDGSGNLVIAFEPKLQVATAGGEVLTVHKITGAARAVNLAFHKNAFALVMAPLDDTAGKIGGAKVSTVQDATTMLTLRSRIWYEGKESAIYVGLDALFGIQVLDEDLATRFYAF